LEGRGSCCAFAPYRFIQPRLVTRHPLLPVLILIYYLSLFTIYSDLLFILIYYLLSNHVLYPYSGCCLCLFLFTIYSYILLFVFIICYTTTSCAPPCPAVVACVYYYLFFFKLCTRILLREQTVGRCLLPERESARALRNIIPLSLSRSLSHSPPPPPLSLGLSRSLARSDARTPSMIIKRVR
jgi:hypothetical protein